MKINEIRKFLQKRPFQPFVIELDNGNKQMITHPEVIVTDTIIAAVDVTGEFVVMSPEAVSAIQVPAQSNNDK